jgi:hypothetical protein
MIHLLLLLSFSLVALGQENSAESWKMETMLVSLNGKLAEVKMAFSEVIVYKNTDPQFGHRFPELMVRS